MHPTPNAISEGDWNRLVSTYKQSFLRTAQPVPGRCLRRGHCVSIWYLETGSTIPDIARLQSASSSTATTPAPDQATQMRYALRIAYCQRYVGAIFNFLIRDDPNLVGYQSGVLWADWTPKGSYTPIKRVVANINSGHISCARPRAPKGVAALAAPGKVSLSW